MWCYMWLCTWAEQTCSYFGFVLSDLWFISLSGQEADAAWWQCSSWYCSFFTTKTHKFFHLWLPDYLSTHSAATAKKEAEWRREIGASWALGSHDKPAWHAVSYCDRGHTGRQWDRQCAASQWLQHTEPQRGFMVFPAILLPPPVSIQPQRHSAFVIRKMFFSLGW